MKFIIFIIGIILILILSHLVLRYGFRRKLERLSKKLRKELPWLVALSIVWVWFVVCTCIFKAAEGKDPAFFIVLGAVLAFLYAMKIIGRIKEDLQNRKEQQEEVEVGV